jgi:hypothetical protein
MLLLAGGCGVSAVQAHRGPHQATTAGCAAYGVRAIERHVTVTRVPAPCQGLSRAEINQAVATAIHRVSGGVPKAVSRRRATAAGAYLAHLITAPAAVPATPAGSRAAPAAPDSGPAASGPVGGKDLPMDLAALAAWLVTAGSGAYLLSRWVSRGGRLRLHAAHATGGAGSPLAAGSPPVVLLGHFGLALGGLLLWLIYLVTGWSVLAWTAVGVLLPVAGLGMATLVVGLPGRSPSVLPVRQAPVLAGRLAADRPTGPPGAGGAEADDAGQPPRATAGRMSALAVAGHGLLAVTTMLLVILAALGTVSR